MSLLPATRGHQMEQLRKAVTSGLALILLSFNSGLAMYLSRDDVQSVACVAVSYLLLVLLVALHLGCGEGTRRGGRLLKAAVSCLTLLLMVLLAYKATTSFAPPSTPVMVVAVAGAAALGLGGGCPFLLHRCSWSKKPRQVMLPLAQELP
ncbi:uncharacterized protein C2845_PM11G01380 [Panicum miliaceum]|uniref:Uncharacterized protein n=1 Tax=Panicum miliaceum TaxID=4540 RepID=A0A3L6RS33_PANMI|nr:uncharacterized protein C2845_PM11G01380 [Panicum miliaceum]